MQFVASAWNCGRLQQKIQAESDNLNRTSLRRASNSATTRRPTSQVNLERELTDRFFHRADELES